MRDKIYVSLWICLFAYRTYLATGMHTVFPVIFSSSAARRKKPRFVNRGALGNGKQDAAKAKVAGTIYRKVFNDRTKPKGQSTQPQGLNVFAEPNEYQEYQRLICENKSGTAGNWKKWGPYLADRQWSTVREDYSADGSWYVEIQITSDSLLTVMHAVC